jgi:ABC-type multidrug transport system ATPase subunit
VADLLDIRNLSKTFKGNATATLQDIELCIPQGQSVALVGANGAGKSTLIKIILGLVKPSSGHVRFMGHEPAHPDALKRIGYLPEIPGFWGELSAQELLSELGSLRELKPEQVQVRSEKLLSLLGLKLRGSRNMGGYSKGMLQRTGVAAALLHDPDFLILDEPMSGLDPRAQEKLRSIVLEAQRLGQNFFNFIARARRHSQFL